MRPSMNGCCHLYIDASRGKSHAPDSIFALPKASFIIFDPNHTQNNRNFRRRPIPSIRDDLTMKLDPMDLDPMDLDPEPGALISGH